MRSDTDNVLGHGTTAVLTTWTPKAIYSDVHATAKTCKRVMTPRIGYTTQQSLPTEGPLMVEDKDPSFLLLMLSSSLLLCDVFFRAALALETSAAAAPVLSALRAAACAAPGQLTGAAISSAPPSSMASPSKLPSSLPSSSSELLLLLLLSSEESSPKAWSAGSHEGRESEQKGHERVIGNLEINMPGERAAVPRETAVRTVINRRRGEDIGALLSGSRASAWLVGCNGNAYIYIYM